MEKSHPGEMDHILTRQRFDGKKLDQPAKLQVSREWMKVFVKRTFGKIPGIPTTIRTIGVNITTIVYLRVLIIEIGSTIVLMVVEAQGNSIKI